MGSGIGLAPVHDVVVSLLRARFLVLRMLCFAGGGIGIGSVEGDGLDPVQDGRSSGELGRVGIRVRVGAVAGVVVEGEVEGFDSV